MRQHSRLNASNYLFISTMAITHRKLHFYLFKKSAMFIKTNKNQIKALINQKLPVMKLNKIIILKIRMKQQLYNQTLIRHM